MELSLEYDRDETRRLALTLPAAEPSAPAAADETSLEDLPF